MESGSWILSWESSIEYYRIINERVRERLGGYHSARSITYSFDFDDIEGLQREGNWEQANRLLTDAANRVHAAGAELLVICTNTMHRRAEDVQAVIDITLVHIAMSCTASSTTNWCTASSDQSLAPCTWR